MERIAARRPTPARPSRSAGPTSAANDALTARSPATSATPAATGTHSLARVAVLPPAPVEVGAVGGAPPVVQRYILKPRKRTHDPTNCFSKFPSKQLRDLGMPRAHATHAMILHRKTNKYYTLRQAVDKAAIKYRAANQGLRVAPPNAGTRINDHNDLINHFSSQGLNTASLLNNFVTKQHGPALDGALSLVPLTDTDLGSVSSKGDPYGNFCNFFNREHVPAMVRSPSFLGEVIDEMQTKDVSGGGYVTASKGSMFEGWTSHHIISGRGRINVPQQGAMNRGRDSDDYDASTRTLYDAKYYDSKMPLGTNGNQYDDYKEIIDQGHQGSGGEVVEHVCYVFPTLAAAQLNAGLKWTSPNSGGRIEVAYPKPGPGSSLLYV